VGCYPRKIVAQQLLLKDFDKWKCGISYGYRWMVVENVFSTMKRMFGEHVTSKKYPTKHGKGDASKGIIVQHACC
jgi:hypothetical protein